MYEKYVMGHVLHWSLHILSFLLNPRKIFYKYMVAANKYKVWFFILILSQCCLSTCCLSRRSYQKIYIVLSFNFFVIFSFFSKDKHP